MAESSEDLLELLDFDPNANIIRLKNVGEHLDLSAQNIELLANACRDPEWRGPIRDAQILDRVLSIFDDKALNDEKLTLQILRFICNAVAEEDESRAKVISQLAVIRNATINTQLRLSALSAVLNICQDYEPGQQAAIEVGIFEDLQQILSQHNRMEVQVGMRLLNVLIPKYTEANEELPISLINRAILTTAAAPSVDSDQEDYLTCIEVLLPILQDDKVKQQIGQSDHKLALFDLLENTLIRLHSAITVEDADGPSDDEDDDDDSDGADDPEEIAGYATQIVAIAADVALHWKLDFVANLLDDDDVKDLIQILRVEPKQEWNQDARLFRSRAAALILGNIAQNDEISEVLGTEENLIASAISIISTPSLDAEARHATAGLLGNLAIEKNNKQRLRAAGAMYATNILLTEENVEVQLAGLKLLRQLLRDSPDNCEDFLNRVTDHSTLNTCKELLKSKNLDGRLQTEAGRVFVSLLRTTAMNSTTEVAFDAELAQLAAASIVSLGTHPDPRVKSECWMALALLSKFDWGAPPILKAFQEEEITPNILEETLSKTPDAENPTAKQDKDNVLVMLNHLIHAAESNIELRIKLRALLIKYTPTS